jgi:hypothetical protein
LEVRAASIISLMMEAARTSGTSVDNYVTRQYIPEDKSERDKNYSQNFLVGGPEGKSRLGRPRFRKKYIILKLILGKYVWRVWWIGLICLRILHVASHVDPVMNLRVA